MKGQVKYGELHGHGATQPCIQAKSTRHPRGVLGEAPRFFQFFFIFFLCKNHLIFRWKRVIVVYWYSFSNQCTLVRSLGFRLVPGIL